MQTHTGLEVEYRIVPLNHAYRVGSDGSVWSRLKKTANTSTAGEITDSWRLVKVSPRKTDKYCQFTMCGLSGRTTWYVHKLVALCFIGECPDGQEVAHKNWVRTDNRPCNLVYKTPLDNTRDKYAHGTMPQGEKCTMSKLTDKAVVFMREKYESGEHNQPALAEMFGVHKCLVSLVVRRKIWRHL